MSEKRVSTVSGLIQYGDGAVDSSYSPVKALRGGDNPHQKGFAGTKGYNIVRQGRGMSFTNHIDLIGYAPAFEMSGTMKHLEDSRQEAVVVNKHRTPCVFAVGKTQCYALRRSMHYDSKSPFGGVLSTSSPLTMETAEYLKELRIENGFTLDVIASPGFEEGVLEYLVDLEDKESRAEKKEKMFNTRVVDVSELDTIEKICSGIGGYNNVFGIGGNPIMTEMDSVTFFNHKYKMEVLSEAYPNKAEMADAHLAWIGAKYIISNSFSFVRDGTQVAQCGGQTNREDSAKFAIQRAKDFGNDVEYSMSATDSFLFNDYAIDILHEAGVNGVVHPTRKDLTTGSLKPDEKILEAVNKCGMIMIRPRLIDEDGNESAWRVFRH